MDKTTLRILGGIAIVALSLYLNHQISREADSRRQTTRESRSKPPIECIAVDLRDKSHDLVIESGLGQRGFRIDAADAAARMTHAVHASLAIPGAEPISGLGLAVRAAHRGLLVNEPTRRQARFEVETSICPYAQALHDVGACPKSAVEAVLEELEQVNVSAFSRVANSPRGCRWEDEQCWIDYRFRARYGVTHDAFIERIATACEVNTVMPVPTECVMRRPIDDGDYHADLIAEYFNATREQAQAIHVRMCEQALLRRGHDDVCKHTAGFILGRRPANGSCEILVRIAKPDAILSALNESRQDLIWDGTWESDTDIWIPEENLYWNILQVEYLEPVRGQGVSDQRPSPAPGNGSAPG